MIWEFLTGMLVWMMLRDFLTVIRRLISGDRRRHKKANSSSSSSSSSLHVSQLTKRFKGGMSYRYKNMWNCFGLSYNNANAGLRFHAFGSRRITRYSSSKVQALIFFNLRHRLDDDNDETNECHQRLICNLAKLNDQKFMMKAIGHKLSQMGLPDGDTKRSWANFIVDFAFIARLFTHFNGSKRMTMIAYIGDVKPYCCVSSEHEEQDDDEEEEEEICLICRDGLRSTKENGGVLTLPCSHLFHGACVAPWFEQKLLCPLCKSKFS